MIEVEKKFTLTTEQETRLCEGAVFLKEIFYTDVYYDTPDSAWMRKDVWLRARDGKWELNISMTSGLHEDQLATQFEELEDEKVIREYLHIPVHGTFAEDLERAGYRPFCTLKTHRRKFKRDPFIIDLDQVEAPNFDYRVSEIELMVEDRSQIEGGIKQITDFASTLGLSSAYVRGKVTEYLKRNKPEYYNILIEAGIVRN